MKESSLEKITTSNRISLKNILFATDFSSHSNAALPYALSIARKYGSKVFAVHVVSLPTFPASSPTVALQAIAAQALREAREAMMSLEPQWKGIAHQPVIRKGDIWKELSAVVHEEQIDLVVVGTRGRSGASKLVMGSVAEAIFRQAPCPVLTIGPGVSAEPDRIVDMHTILYPTDFSPESLAAAPFAISLAQEHQARLYLLHVAKGATDAVAEASLETALRNLVPPGLGLSCAPKASIEYGTPAVKILDWAEKFAVDLIVLGVKRAAILPAASTHLVLATAYKVVAEAICPVLTVRG